MDPARGGPAAPAPAPSPTSNGRVGAARPAAPNRVATAAFSHIARPFGRGGPDGPDTIGLGMESRRVLARWVLLSPIIGVVAGVGAIVFFRAIELATTVFLNWG